MDELIMKIIENSLIGGAFLFLLYQFVTKFTKTQENIVSALAQMSKTMGEMSIYLKSLDDRVKDLEDKKE
jgi:hypothetical protein